MNAIAELHHAVQTAIAGKRLGKPVFVRYLLTCPDKIPLVARLACITAVVRGWLGQTLENIQAIGSAAAGQVSLTLQFREGGSALVSVSRGQRLGDGVDLLVLGNHGALYHDAGHAAAGDVTSDLPNAPPQRALLAAIDKALRSGNPEPVRMGARS
jgi:hypothetical protein